MDYFNARFLLTTYDNKDYASLDYILGCSHGCRYPCSVMCMLKHMGRIKNYSDWIKPKICKNIINKLKNKLKTYPLKKIRLVEWSDPFMYKNEEIEKLSLKIIKIINNHNIHCIIWTKGIIPEELKDSDPENEYAISLVSVNEEFRIKYEPFTAPFKDRINALYKLQKNNLKTSIHIRPWPTPNIIKQKLSELLEIVGFADRYTLINWNNNKNIIKFENYKNYYKEIKQEFIEFCRKNKKNFGYEFI